MKRWLIAALSALVPLVLLGSFSHPTVAGPVQITPLPPVEETDGRAGACFSYYPNDPGHPYLPMVYDAGSRWDRFNFNWPTIEPTNDGWNYPPYDDLVDDLVAGGIENLVGILIWTPDWAASGVGMSELAAPFPDRRPPGWYAPVPHTDLAPMAISAWSSPPYGLDLPWDHPDNHWGDYVFNVVSHFGNRVKYWEMWNEVEWDYFWTGYEKDYAKLLKVGYQATKAACPDCQVLFAGLHFWEDQDYFGRVLDILNDDQAAPANDYFFDVMSVHLYSTSATVYDVVSHIRARMNLYVSDHPIWLTETGVPVWGDDQVDPYVGKYEWAATQDEAAAYTIQSYANAWASHVERYFFFRTNDQDMSEYFGLIRNDRTLRPAYVAYQVATTYLVSPTMATSWTYTGSGVRRVSLWGTPRGKVSVLWNVTPNTTTFSYDGTLPTATLVDRWGVTQTISAASGVYSLTLPGATANLVSDPDNYFIGGEPYLVIEADTAPPTAAVQPLPPTTYSTTIPVSWDGADDAAGIWGFDVQAQKGSSGAWTDWLRFTQTQGVTSSLYTADAQHGETYCFRARAWDRAGNRGEWPADAQSCTTLDLRREVHLDLQALFGDENSDGQWDGAETALASLRLRLVDAAGSDAVTPTVGSSWEFTATLPAGDYTLIVTPDDWPSLPPGWLPRWLPTIVEMGGEVQDILIQEVGLLPHRSSSLLPLVVRNG
jgi:hypothetical protein